MERPFPPSTTADSSPTSRPNDVVGSCGSASPTNTAATPSSSLSLTTTLPSDGVQNAIGEDSVVGNAGGGAPDLVTHSSQTSDPESAPATITAKAELNNEIENALTGDKNRQGADKERLLELCKVIDYWIADHSTPIIESVGLRDLASEIRRDYVLASFLAWRGEYKLSYITLRSFLESFCLLLYYLNQGCDRMLYLRGKGYKLMLHRMAQKKQDPDDTHAFRRHYELLLTDEENPKDTFPKKFFDEMTECYSILSKAVHGDYKPKTDVTPEQSFIALLERVLRVCNTLALHDPMLDATDDDLAEALKGILNPTGFERKA